MQHAHFWRGQHTVKILKQQGMSMRQRGGAWVMSQAALLILFIGVRQLGPSWPYPTMFRVCGGVFAAAGVLLLIWSALNLGPSLTPFPRPLPTGHLVTTGAYGWIRHPIYFAVLLTCLGLSLATHSPLRLLVTAVLFVFFDRKASREEVWLQQRYPEYGNYKRRIKKLIPRIY